MENNELYPIYLAENAENVIDILAGSEGIDNAYVVVQCSIGGASCKESCSTGCKESPKEGSCSKGCQPGCKTACSDGCKSQTKAKKNR